MSIRLLVCGDREWSESDRPYLYAVLDAFHEAFAVEVVIEGEAPGADRQAADWAMDRAIPYLPYPAEWERHRRPSGKNPAGPIRNRQMLREGKPQHVLAFHRRPDQSRGTKDMAEVATAAGIPVDWIPFEGTRPWWSPIP